MTTVLGTSVEDGIPREIDITRDGVRILLHIHTPGDRGNGWAIAVSMNDLVLALNPKGQS